MRMQIIHGRDAVLRIVIRRDLVQAHYATIVLFDFFHRAGRVVCRDLFAPGNEVEEIDRFVVFAQVVVALGRTPMVVEGHTRAQDIDESRALMLNSGLEQRHELILIAREAAPDKGRAELHGNTHQVDGAVGVDHAFLRLRAGVGGGGELALGQAVHAIVLDHVEHIHAAPNGVRELAKTNRG